MQAVDNAERSEHKCNFVASLSHSISFLWRTCRARKQIKEKKRRRPKMLRFCRRCNRILGYRCDCNSYTPGSGRYRIRRVCGFFYFRESRYANYSRAHIFVSLCNPRKFRQFAI